MITWERALDLETKVAILITRQSQYGVAFDLEKANKCIDELQAIIEDIHNQIRPYLLLDMIIEGGKLLKDINCNEEVFSKGQVSFVKKIFKKNGDYTQQVTDWIQEVLNSGNSNFGRFSIDSRSIASRLVSGPFTRIRWEEPSLTKREKLAKQLLYFGWKPEHFSPTGQPQLTIKGVPVESLENIEGPIGKLIGKYYLASHRQGQIKGWIENVRSDGRIEAQADTVGTNTARMKHRIVVNCPKADPKVFYGHQMRDLFIASKDHLMVGYDASGLEARMMAHYTYPFDKGEFGNELLHGDIHTKNMNLFCEVTQQNITRSIAKNGFYALCYGCSVNKFAQTIGCKQSAAKRAFDSFWHKNYALGKLRDKVIQLAERYGYLPGIDGRKIYVRSSHSALNALFQSAGSICMKTAMVILDETCQREEIYYKKLIDMHDESQAEILETDIIWINNEDLGNFSNYTLSNTVRADGSVGFCKYGHEAINSISKAGESLGIRIPLTGEYKIGKSWAECH